MDTTTLDTIAQVGLFALVLMLIPCGWRAWKGPSVADRLLAVDLITTLLIGIIVLVALLDNIPFLVDLAIALAALSFIATVSIARYISDGKVF